jgi:hypothetical protein
VNTSYVLLLLLGAGNAELGRFNSQSECKAFAKLVVHESVAIGSKPSVSKTRNASVIACVPVQKRGAIGGQK